MDYLDARWLLLKRINSAGLAELHRRELPLWRRSREGGASLSAPVWWQAGQVLLSALTAGQGPFWSPQLRFEERAKRAAAFRAAAEKALRAALPELALETLCDDAPLLHRCDRIIFEQVCAPPAGAQDAPLSARAQAALQELEA